MIKKSNFNYCNKLDAAGYIVFLFVLFNADRWVLSPNYFYKCMFPLLHFFKSLWRLQFFKSLKYRSDDMPVMVFVRNSAPKYGFLRPHFFNCPNNCSIIIFVLQVLFCRKQNQTNSLINFLYFLSKHININNSQYFVYLLNNKFLFS